VEYMASVLNSRLDHPDKIVNSINECSKLGIPVLLPDINRSGEFFTIDKDSDTVPCLRFGLAAVKTVGEVSVKPIVEELKKNGPFQSIDDFCRRADVSGLNRRTLESLVKAGAFDSFGTRGAVHGAMDQILATAQLETRMRNSGQTSMFGTLAEENTAEQMVGINLNGTDVDRTEKAAWERELLGVALSYNPLMDLATMDVGNAVNSLGQLDDDMQGKSLAMVGQVSICTERYTKEQKKFLVVSLDLLDGQVEVIVWPDVLERTREIWQEGILVKANGKVRIRGDQYSLACEQVQAFTAVQQTPNSDEPVVQRSPDAQPASYDAASKQAKNHNGGPAASSSTIPYTSNRTVYLGINESEDAVEDAHLLREVIRMLLEYPGKDRINLEIHMSKRRVLMELPVVSTGYCEELKIKLEQLLGSGSVRLGQDGFPNADAVPQ